jgi:hypothetical protein
MNKGAVVGRYCYTDYFLGELKHRGEEMGGVQLVARRWKPERGG